MAEEKRTTVEQYKRLFEELQQARTKAGGELPQDEESNFVSRLSDIWWTLTNEEQDELDAYYGKPQ